MDNGELMKPYEIQKNTRHSYGDVIYRDYNEDEQIICLFSGSLNDQLYIYTIHLLSAMLDLFLINVLPPGLLHWTERFEGKVEGIPLAIYEE